MVKITNSLVLASLFASTLSQVVAKHHYNDDDHYDDDALSKKSAKGKSSKTTKLTKGNKKSSSYSDESKPTSKPTYKPTSAPTSKPVSAVTVSDCDSSEVQEAFAGDNPCADANPKFPNVDCVSEDISEQSGANVTEGYQGLLETEVTPITTSYWEQGLCPVNVHWHLGAEHYSAGEYDESGTGPTEIDHRRKLSGKTRQGYQCNDYDESDSKFTTHYDWQHCTKMEVGQTYEVHWPHSALGACGTPNQYQTPFLDGVFCDISLLVETHTQIGVQAQVFTIVDDEDYYYPDLIRGMIVDGDYGSDVAKYTGSSTGTSRNNTLCSAYTPITWQVDRKCQLISASTFDKMCSDMKAQRDDMSDDLYPHGARELVSDELAANNHHLRR